jgi:gliding motility-associated-like protein
MRYVPLLSACIFSIALNAQSSFVGMAAMTHYPVDTSSELVMNVYDTRDVVVNAPQGNNWALTNLLTTNSADPSQFKVSRMGSVFGVTIDRTGNFYVTSCGTYNLPSVVEGTAGAAGIYRVNALDWSVDDFVTTVNAPTSTSTTQIPNTGCGLGNINYDPFNNQLFVTNFEDGKIYRLDMSGNILSKHDPFTADNAAPGFADLGELPYGVAVTRDGLGNTRLFFSVWCANAYMPGGPPPAPRDKNCIYSIGLDANGDFTGTAQFEYQVEDFSSQWSPLGPGCVISSLNFSADGKLLVAERSMLDMSMLSAHNSRVYILENSTGTWILERWLQIGVIGLDDQICANTSGGADFGFYDDDASPGVNAGCEQLVWSSSDAIKYDAYNPDGSPHKVYGLTGVKRSGNSMIATDPDYVYTTSYMIDLNGDLTDQPKTWLGSCTVWSDCEYDPCENYECNLVNVFTPNKDGKNDFLSFTCIAGDGWGLQVFDRWGAEVYQSDNYQNDWDGGQLVEGVYYYILTSACDGRKMNAFCHLQRTTP